MSELTTPGPDDDWKLVAGFESYGGYEPFGPFRGRSGVKILIRPELVAGLDQKIAYEIGRMAERINEIILLDHARRDPVMSEKAATEKAKLIGMFAPGTYSWVKTVPNEYGPESVHQALYPWYVVYTSRGPIKVGWRKRVINIDWSEIDHPPKGPDVFAEEDEKGIPTVGRDYIHAYSYEDGRSYIERILSWAT